MSLTSDLATELWRKLCVNVSGGSLTALTRQPMGVLRVPEIAAIAAELISECATTARASGARLDARDESAVLAELRAAPAEATTSMMRARRAADDLEYDAISGAVLRAARQHGIPVPTTSRIHALLAASCG